MRTVVSRPKPKLSFQVVVILGVIALALVVTGWISDVQGIFWGSGFLVIVTFFILVYKAVRKSQDRSYHAEGSSPETWRTYH